MNPSDEQLVAYLDGELDEEERSAVELCLEGSAEARARLQRLTEATALVREAFDEVLREPVPPELLRVASGRQSAQIISFKSYVPGFGRHTLRIPKRWAGLAAAASVAGLVFGSGIGYVVHPSSSSPLDNIASYHKLFIASAEAGENGVFDVQPGGEQRLPGDIHVPDLKPYQLEFQGARKIVIEGKPAYQFYYTTANKQIGSITLTLWESEREDRQPTFDQRENVNLIYWRHSGRGYALVGHADKGWMSNLAQDIAYQLHS